MHSKQYSQLGLLPSAVSGDVQIFLFSLTISNIILLMGEYKLHVSTFATTRVALLTGGAAR